MELKEDEEVIKEMGGTTYVRRVKFAQEPPEGLESVRSAMEGEEEATQVSAMVSTTEGSIPSQHKCSVPPGFKPIIIIHCDSPASPDPSTRASNTGSYRRQRIRPI